MQRKYALVSTPVATILTPNPLRQTQTLFSRSMGRLRAKTRYRVVRKGWVRGGSKARRGYATKCTVRIVHPLRSTPPCGLRAIAVTGNCRGPRSRVKNGEGEERRGCGGRDEGMWTLLPWLLYVSRDYHDSLG